MIIFAAPSSSAEPYTVVFDNTEDIWITQGESNGGIVEFTVHSGVYDLSPSKLNPWFYAVDSDGKSGNNRLMFEDVSCEPLNDAAKYVVFGVHSDFKVEFYGLERLENEHSVDDPGPQSDDAKEAKEAAIPNMPAVMMAIAVIISVISLLLSLAIRRNIANAMSKKGSP
jgi:hypothetical protein